MCIENQKFKQSKFHRTGRDNKILRPFFIVRFVYWFLLPSCLNDLLLESRIFSPSFFFVSLN